MQSNIDSYTRLTHLFECVLAHESCKIRSGRIGTDT